jgi:hypothetical protein
MAGYAGCRYCRGVGCLACEGEEARASDAPALPLTQRAPQLHGRDPLVATHPAGNPRVTVFGPGPADVTCATCEHLHRLEYARAYFKCDQRPVTGGPGTDHRRNWPACARYTVGTPHEHAASS